MGRNKNVRYQLSANDILNWKGSGGAYLQAEGLSRDISPLGAFVISSRCPPISSAVQVDMFIFPSCSGSTVPSLKIRAEAQVVRIDYTETHAISGFSVERARFRFWPRGDDDRVPAFSRWSDALGYGSLGKGQQLAETVFSTASEDSPVPVGFVPSAPLPGTEPQ
jgi:hypothetical protein